MEPPETDMSSLRQQAEGDDSGLKVSWHGDVTRQRREHSPEQYEDSQKVRARVHSDEDRPCEDAHMRIR